MSTATATNTVIMNGFVIVSKNTNSVVFYGTRLACRIWRRAQSNINDYSGALPVNADLPIN